MTRPVQKHVDEIDFLRALSVVLIVLFHFLPGRFPGGFIGVDIFFVISGYVISRAFFHNLVDRKLSVVAFFLARLRRLVPALAFMLVLVSLATGVLLYPDDLEAYARSLLVQPLFLQNFAFWVEGDYFRNSLQKPLLHTWSLGVEEQFYIAWAVMMIVFRRHFGAALVLFLLLAIMSFALSMALDVRSPKTVFFMMPTRLWEFALGMLAFLLRHRYWVWRVPLGRGVEGAVLVLIVLVSVTVSGAAPHLTLVLLAVCTGTALLLVSLDTDRVNMFFYRWRPALFLGRISYGLYLWHWPPLALFVAVQDRFPDAWEILALLFVSFCLAVLSFYLVERPVRYGVHFRQARTVVMMTVSCGFAVIGLGLVSMLTDGGLFRYPAPIQAYFQAAVSNDGGRCSRLYILKHPGAEFCPVNDVAAGLDVKKVLVLGDSHANAVKNMLGRIGQQAGVSVYLTARNCDLGEYGRSGFCSAQVMTRVIAKAKQAGIGTVLMISRWDNPEFSSDAFQTQLGAFQANGFRIGIVKSVPFDSNYAPGQRARTALHHGAVPDATGMDVRKYEARMSRFNGVMHQLKGAGGDDLTFLLPATVLCGHQMCRYAVNGEPLYRDMQHLSDAGAAYLRPLFDAFFTKISLGAAGGGR